MTGQERGSLELENMPKQMMKQIQSSLKRRHLYHQRLHPSQQQEAGQALPHRKTSTLTGPPPKELPSGKRIPPPSRLLDDLPKVQNPTALVPIVALFVTIPTLAILRRKPTQENLVRLLNIPTHIPVPHRDVSAQRMRYMFRLSRPRQLTLRRLSGPQPSADRRVTLDRHCRQAETLCPGSLVLAIL